MAIDERLSNIEEKIISYIYTKGKILGEVEVSSRELAVALGIVQNSAYQSLSNLVNKKYLLSKHKEKEKIYIITTQAKEYVEQHDISLFDENEIKALTFKDTQYLKESLNEIILLKKEIDKIKNTIEKDRNNFQGDFIEIKDDLYRKIDSFYGRIGEILTLIITAIAMIVFNIQLIGSVEIDFTNPVLAFKTILAIDLPYIILFVLYITAFHFVIGKDYKDLQKGKLNFISGLLLRTFPMIIVIIVSYLLLVYL